MPKGIGRPANMPKDAGSKDKKTTSHKFRVLVTLCLGVCVFVLSTELIYDHKNIISIELHLGSIKTRLLHSSTNETMDFTSIQPLHHAEECIKNTTLKSRHVNVNLTSANWSDLFNLTAHLKPGGSFEPSNCSNPDRVAIVVPYRAREHQLTVFLQHMHPFLQRQRLHYTIFIIEPVPDVPFNRGLLLNIGYAEGKKHGDFKCFIFHDVDLLPENDANMYTCPTRPGHPRHLSVAIDKFNYRLPYATLIGGATAFLNTDFLVCNGFSNMYFLWGGEDDDLALRLHRNNMTITRYPVQIGRYKMIKHAQEKTNPHRQKLLQHSTSRMREDGLNSLEYSVLNTDTNTTLYTRILISIDMKNYNHT